MSAIPIGQFDGQVFYDAFGIKWIFNNRTKCWMSAGKPEEYPVANATTTGLLSRDLKALMEKVAYKGGGYAILTDSQLSLRTQENPDGVLFGDVELVSDTLDIKCVFANGKEIVQSNCVKFCFTETDDFPPGFDINLSKKFFDITCIEVPGGPGPKGALGEEGDPGEDGTGDGPVGRKGDKGADALTHHKITGIKIIDIDDVFDTGVVNLELDKANGRMYVTKSKIKTLEGSDSAVDQFITKRIERNIKFNGNCFDYDLVVQDQGIPCGGTKTYDTTDPVIAFYPSHFDPDNAQNKDETYQVVRRRLSNLVDDIISFYQQKIEDASAAYDKQIKTFIEDKDKEARSMIDSVANELAECEHITYIDFCIGMGKEKCVNENFTGVVPGAGTVGGAGTPNSSDCTAVLAAGNCDGGSCESLPDFKFIPQNMAIFSFQAPDQFKLPFDETGNSGAPGFGGGVRTTICRDSIGCWANWLGGTIFIPRGGQIPRDATLLREQPNNVNFDFDPTSPTIYSLYNLKLTPAESTHIRAALTAASRSTDAAIRDQANKALTYFNKGLSSPYLVAFMFRDWADGLIANLKAGFAIYPKQQLANGASKEFSPGVYVFEISNGALKQERLNEVERGGTDPSDPSFINGPYQDFWVGGHDTDALGPYYIINPYDQANPIQFDAPVTNESYGLEIGFAPTSYKSQIPENLFSTHQYNISALVGDAFLLPLPWVNYTALSPDIKAMEDKITWKPFPVAGGNAADQASIEASYDNGTIAERSVIWETEEPGFFFIRTKSTYNILNRYGTLKMPPVTPAHGGQIKDATFNKAEIRRLNNYPPTINARPIVDGSVDIKITKLNGCAEARAAAEAIAAAKDQASAEGFTPPA